MERSCRGKCLFAYLIFYVLNVNIYTTDSSYLLISILVTSVTSVFISIIHILKWDYINRITGLDPAGVIFDGRAPHDRLNPYSAAFVDVIHSDPNRYGSRRELGTVDFWPNFRNFGPVVQPGCDNKSHPRFTPEGNFENAWKLHKHLYLCNLEKVKVSHIITP